MKLDLRGEVCPSPLVHTVEALGHLKVDDELVVHIDHRPALSTIPWQAAKRGYLADAREVGPGEWQITLRRTSDALDPLAIVHHIARQVERETKCAETGSVRAPSDLRSVTPAEAVKSFDRGAIALDMRGSFEFGRAHVPGAINVSFSNRQFAQRVALVVAPGGAVVLVGDDLAQIASAKSALQTAGRYEVLGYLEGGVAAWQAAGLSVGVLAQMSIHDLRSELATPRRDLAVLDVRETFEWEELGHIAGAILISLGELTRRLEELPRGRPVAAICEHGLRSSAAASLLAQRGFVDLLNIAEGMAGWRSVGYPLVEKVAY